MQSQIQRRHRVQKMFKVLANNYTSTVTRKNVAGIDVVF